MNIIVILSFLFVTRAHEEHRIIGGGSNCSITDYSYVVAIIHGEPGDVFFIGGGTLLSAAWVLTVPNHLHSCKKKDYYKVIAGAESLSEYTSTNENVRSSVVKRCYSSWKQHSILGLTLLRASHNLKEPFLYDKKISYVPWARKKDLENRNLDKICRPAMIMGYGVEHHKDIMLPVRHYQNLHCGKIPVISDKDCKSKLPLFEINFALACVFGKGASSCQGDAGGPVICNGIQYGVLSPVIMCGRKIPVPFIKVHTYEKFIEGTMNNYVNRDDKSKCNSNYFLNVFLLQFSFILHLIIANFNVIL